MKRKSGLFKVLSWLIRSGIPLMQALEIIHNDQRDATVRILAENIKKGENLSDAMRISGKFSPIDCHTVKTGEMTASLAQVLLRLSELYEGEIRLRKTIAEALSYPVIVAFSSVAAVVVMSLFVTPMLEEVFLNSGRSLPPLTRWLLSLSDSMPRTLTGIAVSAAALSSLHFLFRNNRKYMLGLQKMMLGLPLVGPWIKTITLSRMSSHLAMMLDAGLSLEESIKMLSAGSFPMPYKTTLEHAGRSLLDGRRLQDSLSEPRYFDSVFRHLLAAGENSGSLVNSLHTLANYYEEALKQKTVVLQNTLQPIMILFSGLMVGLVLLGFYLPMFELGSGMQQ